MGDAMAVGDDNRRAVECFGFEKCFQRVLVFRSHRDRGHVNRPVSHRHQAEIFLRAAFASGGELGDRGARRCFGTLAAGVGINFRVEQQDLDVAPAGQDVIESAVADVVTPAVTADDPNAFSHEQIGQGEEAPGPDVV